MLRTARLERAKPRQAADLLAGKWHANIHTVANPGGERRGQTMK
ncbi:MULTISPECIES: CHRD domain-containing protein [unclassified Bradyrhizobium]